LKDDEVIKRAKEIHILHLNGEDKEAKRKFKELVSDTMSWCEHCRKYVPIEIDRSTGDKPFYFCIVCGNSVKKIEIQEGRIIELRFHKGKPPELKTL
jgi:rRNA maturation endonuclease Nob1